jgi:glycosyltransferase involved in cell wall biosynthesis
VTINQWVPAAHVGDAVGDHIRALRDLLRAWGHESDIFARHIDADLRGDVRAFSDPAARDGDITVMHFAVASDLNAAFGSLPGARVLYYHNVTPAHFFAPYDAGIARLCHSARGELAALAGRVDLAVGASDYNRRELEALGFARTAVLPILVNTRRLTDAPAAPALEHLLRDGLTNILFVGRLAPNKRIEDHIRLAEHYKRYVDARYRFIFVGRTDAVPAYFTTIRALAHEFRLLPERFWFTGPLPDDELAACYRHAHVYLSLSEHEGFGVPLIEAMSMDVPVLAYAGAAVPETLGGAGMSFAPKDLEMAAELLGQLIYDQPLRRQVIDGQRRRVADFDPGRLAAAWQRSLETVIT